MNFQCSNCGHDHNVQTASIRVNPDSGTLLGVGWFKDESGVNHQATVCLKCGTVHATHGSPIKALFSFGNRMLSVKFYMTPEKLQGIIDGQVSGTSIDDLNLDAEVVEILSARGFINQKLTIDIYGDSTPQGVEIGKLFARKYIMFCGVFGFELAAEESFAAFIDQAAEDAQSESPGETAQVVAATMVAVQKEILTMEMLWELTKYTTILKKVRSRLYFSR